MPTSYGCASEFVWHATLPAFEQMDDLFDDDDAEAAPAPAPAPTQSRAEKMAAAKSAKDKNKKVDR